MHRPFLVRSASFCLLWVASALSGCSSDADPETSGGTGEKTEPTDDGGSGPADTGASDDEGTVTVEASSTSGATVARTYRAPKRPEGAITSDFVSCVHEVPISSGRDPSVIVSAGTPEGVVEVYFAPSVWEEGPMKRTDTYDPAVPDRPPVEASIEIGPDNRYRFFHDEAAGLTSTCTTELTEFTETRLRGNATCTDLVPTDSAVDHQADSPGPQHSATMTITFDCPLD